MTHVVEPEDEMTHVVIGITCEGWFLRLFPVLSTQKAAKESCGRDCQQSTLPVLQAEIVMPVYSM